MIIQPTVYVFVPKLIRDISHTSVGALLSNTLQEQYSKPSSGLLQMQRPSITGFAIPAVESVGGLPGRWD
jgi:hypothetical protein